MQVNYCTVNYFDTSTLTRLTYMIAITTFASTITQNFGINHQSANRSKPSKTKVNHIAKYHYEYLSSMQYIQTLNTNEIASYCCGFYENGSQIFYTPYSSITPYLFQNSPPRWNKSTPITNTILTKCTTCRVF